ncbi:Ku protein [Solirubrobacter ginsenosidimutans]|uniref:Non-homologous end joining protein Ku n=1 Tax=Solirubrobacter ginsenosidimutans TaxID=490573 RepID=A0A9X3S3T1_9ACTN|nr:Ku protein [Solirubrobacter ginsenosidimutans]MDA0162406.1 Ku protein [Solirubrobacter ginsenosidimutans]
MAPRSIWNGTIVFGLVNVPVKVYSATESKSIHFHQVHLSDGARIEHRLVCPKEDKEVPRDEIVKGYELSNGSFVELAKDEIAAAAGERSKLIDVEHFVEGEAIDPAFYDKTYYLGAGDDGEDAYRLLRKALETSGKVAIARWTFHDRERLVAVRPLGKILSLQTMNFHDEVVEVDDLDLPSPQRNPADREIEMAGKLVKSLAAKFEPETYEDTYREAVLAVIKRKAKGEEIVEEPEETKQQDTDDLMAALEASL